MAAAISGFRDRFALADARRVVQFVWTHPANRGQRLRRLARAAGFQLRARLLHHRVQTAVGDRARIWVELHRTAATKALYANPADWPEMRVWQLHLRPGDLFVDIGANVGTYTVLAASLGAEVIAVEAARDAVELLQENVELNGFQSVKVVPAAVAETAGKARFSAGLDAGNHFDPAGCEQVETVTLDQLLGDRRAAGVKVDVEGFELPVLRGGARALSEQRIELLQLEWNDASTHALGISRQPLAELLRSLGYQLLRPDGTGQLVSDPEPVGIADVFAAPSGWAPRTPPASRS